MRVDLPPGDAGLELRHSSKVRVTLLVKESSTTCASARGNRLRSARYGSRAIVVESYPMARTTARC
jgi:hypothetical protein